MFIVIIGIYNHMCNYFNTGSVETIPMNDNVNKIGDKKEGSKTRRGFRRR